MLIRIPAVLAPEALARAQHAADRRPLGRTARPPPARRPRQVKNNQQLPRHLRAGAARCRRWCSARSSSTRCSSRPTLPKKLFPPHVQPLRRRAQPLRRPCRQRGALRAGAAALRVRTDVSCTLFLADPSSYDGGELVIDRHLRRAARQAGRRRRGALPRHQRAPRRAGHARRAAGQLLLDREHGAQRRAAPAAVRHGHGADAPARARTARPTRPWR